MKKILATQIETEILVCPYCMDEVSYTRTGCCGESSAHFEKAYVINNETFLKSEVEVIMKQQKQVKHYLDMETGELYAFIGTPTAETKYRFIEVDEDFLINNSQVFQETTDELYNKGGQNGK